MTPEEREAIYDTEIAPELSRLGRRCQECGMSIVCAVEYDAEEMAHGQTAAMVEGHSAAMRLTYAAMKAKGNLDALVIGAGKSVRQTNGPHSSAILALIGIDPDPAKRKTE